jgi:COPII coat assembly protein SEC16
MRTTPAIATMSAETANASWHPAFMPNVSSSVSSKPVATSDTTSWTGTSPYQPTEPAAALIESQEELEPLSEGNTTIQNSETWFSQDSTEDWLAAEDSGIGANEEIGAIQVEDTPTAAADQQQTSPPKAKHVSSVSFARTVSHDVSWNDEEDADWNPPRTGTDPFDFMPPSDRTNSFPPVPLSVRQAADSHPHPLASSRVEELMADLEGSDNGRDLQTHEHHDETAGSAHDKDFWEQDNEENSTAQQYYGSDLKSPEEQASEARFEEGVPLISHDDERDAVTVLDVTEAERVGPFSPGAASDDDFFSQLEGPGDASADTYVSALQRKSTMQVLGALNGVPLHGQSVLHETLEEAGEDDAGGDLGDAQNRDNLGTSDAAPAEVPAAPENQTSVPVDLDSKWKEAFAGDDDDDFLLEDSATETREVDPSAFFGSDDEGFLEDTEDGAPQPQSQERLATFATAQAVGYSAPLSSPGLQNRYAPQTPVIPQQPPTGSPYVPLANAPMDRATNTFTPNTTASPFGIASSYAPQTRPEPPIFQASYGMPANRPEPPKAQSFADKAKGGYTSPYDLPMEVVKPRKRPSMNFQRTTPTSVPPMQPPQQLPPRSSSMLSQASPTPKESISSLSPPTSSHSNLPRMNHKPSAPTLRNKESFFEELPVVLKPRPGSRQMNRIPSPSHQSPIPAPHGPPLGLGPPMLPQIGTQVSPTTYEPPPMSRSASGGISGLVAPPRVSPYAPLQTNVPPPAGPTMPPVASSSAHYSPAPIQTPPVNGPVPMAQPNRYSPAPTNNRPPAAAYNPVSSGVPPAILHQPRTSSPLAHFEISSDRSQSAPVVNGDHSQADRRGSANYEARVNRVAHLPPTRELPEEEAPYQLGNVPPVSHLGAAEPRYGPPPVAMVRQTPPPESYPAAHSTLSPPKRRTSNYTPPSQVAGYASHQEFAPPPRSHTQSPGALYGNRGPTQPAEPVPRPSSVHSPTSPRAIKSSHSGHSRHRGPSLSFNMVEPVDGRQNDPLKRWKGAPLISWGVGGAIVTSFPKNVPRYGINQTTPMIVRTPGEIRVKNVRDIQPLEERLAKFPGPLRGKSKKKETVAWLTTGIEALEQILPNASFSSHVSHDDKRLVERVLLWKILRIFIEFDGTLEGASAVEKAVRDVLAPGIGENAEGGPLYANGVGVGALQESASTRMQADEVDSSTIDQIRKHLLMGDREKAVWAAVDKRLWGHAMLISNTVSPDLYKQVAQEFVRKEVNYPGHNNESIAALYKVFSGNFDECVDELVPVHARAGLQLMATSAGSGPTKDGMEGLDKWRETLSLILGNRSPEDARALNALGNLLSGYGRAEAAHICFFFARQVAVFGGLDDPNSNFVLVGADHRRQPEQFGKETESLLLSEVYEYGLSLAGGSNLSAGTPHLAAYKLQHAMTLAEYGYRDKALQYCDVIANSITSQTRRSPYHHTVLEAAVEDFMKRLKQAPKEESNSWIPKPSMNKVSDSVWNRFNKFVAGDDNESSGAASPADGAEAGPFARVAGGTPTISRSPSVSNFDLHGGNSAGYPVGGPPVGAPANRTASRYAPMTTQPQTAPNPYEPASNYAPAPRSSMERTSNDLVRPSYEPAHQAPESQPGYGSMYGAQSNPMPSQPYQPYGYGAAIEPSLGSQARSAPSPHMEQPAPPMPPMPPVDSSLVGYRPYSEPPAAAENTFSPSDSQPSQGYQPPPYGYEPPSFTGNDERPSQNTDTSALSGYEAPSYQPYGYEAPSYEPNQPTAQDEEEDDISASKSKRGPMYDDDDDVIQPETKGKSKAEKDKENEEMFRKAAEEDGMCFHFMNEYDDCLLTR